jgi:disulfide bond formation protein DsbB
MAWRASMPRDGELTGSSLPLIRGNGTTTCLPIRANTRQNGRVNQEAFELFSAILALATLAAGIITLAALVFEKSMSWAGGWLTQVRASGLWIICMITTGAMVGSLYFSEKVGFAPCKLCWYQRIAMFSIAIISFVAALRNDKNIARYTIVLAPLGLIVSTYHYLLEWFPTLETNVCSLDVPCTAVWFRELGFVTLCFMAGCAFITVIAVSLAIIREQKIDSTSTHQEN